jgi:hypothetical protein
MERRMIFRLVAVVAIAAVMMLSSYAVAEQLSQAEEDAVFANAIIDTYKCNQTFVMNTMMEMKGNVTGEIDVIMVINGSYIVNNTNETMPVKTGNWSIVNESISKNTTGKIAEIVIVQPETVSVRINDSLYMVYLWKPKLSELLDNIGSPESYERFWKSQGLLNSSDVELLADEMVDGVNCKVLRIVAETETFWDIVINKSEKFSELQILLGFDNNQSITAVSTTQWIAKDTGFPQKSETTLKTVTNLKDFDESDTEEEFTMTRDVTMEMQFSDYNEPESDRSKGPY